MRRAAHNESGFALMVVLLVLLALLVLCTPFLISARNADRASAQISDRTQSRVALDTAARHARAALYKTHPGVDDTPYYDSLEEITVHNQFAPGFLDARDEHGVMWDVEVTDAAGLIDLNSASPHVIANLIEASTRFTEVVDLNSKELKVASTNGFEPKGFLWVGGELIHYTRMADGAFADFQRGVLGPPTESEWRGGPRPPSSHDAGAPVLDQRAFALCLWRLDGTDGRFRTLDAIEELADAGSHSLARITGGESAAGTWNADLLRPLVANGTVHAGLCAGPMWQHAARLVSPVEGGKDGKISVDCTRWLNPGATIEISDGVSTELAIVQSVPRVTEGGRDVVLDKILSSDYAAYRAQVRVLARRPVNLNTARVEVLRALFTNLQLVGRNSRITRDEANTLADLVVKSRPFTGFEDFLRRIVLPAGGIEKLPSDAPTVPEELVSGAGFIDPQDAVALYRNGLNANDSALLYSTMPYSFSTRDTYAFELRATVNAPSGVERTSSVRDEVEIVAPQQELLQLWSRQEDWDEARRLSCAAPWWMSGPRSTTRWEYNGAIPPSYVWAHMGTAKGQPYLPGVTDMTAFANEATPPVPEHVFPSREDDGFVQLWPSRVVEDGTTRKNRVIHFDHETRDPEGRYLPDEIVQKNANDKQVAWAVTPPSNPEGAELRALSFSMWIKPRAIADSVLLDVANTDTLADRASLLFEGKDLVLRVLDGMGDHPDTNSFNEASELRYEIAQGNGPGLPIDRWSHVEIDVRGSRPDQLSMLVNGLAHGVRTPGLTRLTGAAPQGAGTLAVESTEGFPQYCTVRVGNELIEVETRKNVFVAAHQETGKLAGFGGRIAREEYTTTPRTGVAAAAATGAIPPVPANANDLDLDHPAGATVELYGYSLPIASKVTVGESKLGAPLGLFRVAVLDGVVGGQTHEGDRITNNFAPLGTYGFGIEGGTSHVESLKLVSADDRNLPPEKFMPAFNTDGGYAALVQIAWNDRGIEVTTSGTPLGGIEVFRYSGWNGNTLSIAVQGQVPQRGDVISGSLPRIPAASGATATGLKIGGRRAFIAHWDPNFKVGGTAIESRLDWRTYVVPISLSVPNAGAADYDVPPATAAQSAFAQLTRIDDAEKTEWVRYDTFDLSAQPAQLVRDELGALGQLYYAVTLIPPPVKPPVDPPQPGGTGTGGTGHGGATEHIVAEPNTITVEPSAVQTAQSYSTDWSPVMGTNENTGFPITEAVSSYFQFRGVFGTYSHEQPQGTSVLPVFTTYGQERYGADRGRPGRLDAAFLVDSSVQSLGSAVRVHRAHIPSATIDVALWRQAGLVPEPATTSLAPHDGIAHDRIYVALQARAPIPLVPTALVANGVPLVDTRQVARLTCFPSGERPRVVERVVIGGGAQGAKSGPVPSAVVDEVIFGDSQFGVKPPVGQYDDLQGACLILTDPLSESAKSLNVNPTTVRVPGHHYPLNAAHQFLADLPNDGGLLRIGDEILAFNTRDTTSGVMGIATNGRGLLGTRAQPHDKTEPVSWLESHPMTFLTADVSADVSALQVADLNDFPSEGTVLIGSELIHYTRRSGNSLEMPRASTVAGAMDEKGEPLFRGRFGTVRATHATGEAVILFPFRYWDRWAPKADAPELAYYGLSLDQPAGLLSSFFFFKSDGEASQIGVLARTDPHAPWDADPDTDPRVKLHWKGDAEGKPLLVNQQSDRVDWRIFVQYAPNAFDLATGMSHGWTESPRLTRFGAFHYEPNLVLRSVER